MAKPRKMRYRWGAAAELLLGRPAVWPAILVANQPPSFFERMMMKLSYGFVPQSPQTWLDRIDTANFRVVDQGDITETVLQPAMQRSITELGQSSPATDKLSRFRKWAMTKGCRSVLRSATTGKMSYQYYVVEKTS